ncbi:HEXXH motif domain-containing protein [Dactylosporangium cerinum]
MLLRTIVDMATATPIEGADAFPPAQAAWHVLEEAEHRDPAACDDILMHPQFGTWAARTLLRLRTINTGPDHPADPPLWLEVGHLHAIAASAAARSGIRYSGRIPVHGGYAVLPGFGAAHVGDHETVAVEIDHGVLHLSGPAVHVAVPAAVPDEVTSTDHRWHPIRRLTATAAGRSLTVTLDDLDPYRDFRDPQPPARLPPEEVLDWHRLLTGAWEILVADDPDGAELLAATVTSVVPLPASRRFQTFSATSAEAFGSVMISLPEDATTLAVTLEHEYQHIKLGGLLHLVQLAIPTLDTATYYAPWRGDPRPVTGLVQGVYAFLGVTRFWQRRREAGLSGAAAELADLEFAHWREQTWDAHAALRGSPALTALGQRWSDRVGAQLARLRDVPVDAGAAAAARMSATDHRAGWRLRHLAPDSSEADRLSAAWAAGQPAWLPPPAVTVTDGPQVRGLGPRTSLSRLRIVDPAALTRLRDAHDDLEGFDDTTAADVALIAGDDATAADHYRAEITKCPTWLSRWTGLGLALRRIRPEAAAALLSQPEWVYAVWHRLAARTVPAPPPDDVAAWLANARTAP